jgi:hypothetical protein
MYPLELNAQNDKRTFCAVNAATKREWQVMNGAAHMAAVAGR